MSGLYRIFDESSSRNYDTRAKVELPSLIGNILIILLPLFQSLLIMTNVTRLSILIMQIIHGDHKHMR